jgi:light-regulated signal transduction histidine kinase (bacteriophytochrome)
MARAIAEEIQAMDPDRQVDWNIKGGLVVSADLNLLRVVLTNLLQNAWKFTSRHETAKIELGCLQKETGLVYFVRDDGAGFDMTYANKLFSAFQRLHTANEFEGTGIGLATVQRIIHRHGGQVWADSAPEQGTTIFFTLP